MRTLSNVQRALVNKSYANKCLRQAGRMKIRNQFQDYKTEDLAKYYYEFVSLGQLFSSSSISSSSLVPNDWFSMERLLG